MKGEPSKRLRCTKSSVRRRRPRSPSPSPPPRSLSPQPNRAHGGVVCLGPIQEGQFDSFLQRVYLDHGILYFHLIIQDYEISLDQINAIVGAPTEHTFGPTNPIRGYFDMTWWTQLTQLHPYVSSAAKASSLIHPLMKVAHRIIASLVAPRKEQSTINPLELKILYVMAHPEDNHIPHYGCTSDRERFIEGVLSACSPRLPKSKPHTPTPNSHCWVSLISALLSMSPCDYFVW
ncbi:unnamed protein product [Lactuca saligna]|uniref:Arabidopsis retrotransposon Orf1 C-terminal domain-containing protein n=1 Tax=Lactuca saligna TaxID=75948 RepID=A0AA35YV73_LACSI|nr:unnamed protein product [Lactuca saligna]